nr:MFS transporter [Chloroflexia bacterium]
MSDRRESSPVAETDAGASDLPHGLPMAPPTFPTTIDGALPVEPIERRSVWSWALYDLANTIFSINIVSFHFSLWVVDDKGGRDAHFMLANSLSMGLMFLSAPVLGALSDRIPRRLPLLATTTLACCSLTALLGTWGLFASLALYIVANYFYQGGLIFYDTLLPSVSTEENRGRVGGLGVAVGYLGSVIGIGIGLTVNALYPDGRVLIFRLTALAFFLFALPCFFFVRERPRADAIGFTFGAVREAAGSVRIAFARVRRFPDLKRFLIAHLLYADAANTAIASLGIYATQEIGFTDQQAQLILLAGVVGAISGGLVLGRMVDRIGPKRTLYRVLAAWFVTLFSIAVIAWLDLPRELFWGVAVLAGVALGGTWT